MVALIHQHMNATEPQGLSLEQRQPNAALQRSASELAPADPQDLAQALARSAADAPQWNADGATGADNKQARALAASAADAAPSAAPATAARKEAELQRAMADSEAAAGQAAAAEEAELQRALAAISAAPPQPAGGLPAAAQAAQPASRVAEDDEKQLRQAMSVSAQLEREGQAQRDRDEQRLLDAALALSRADAAEPASAVPASAGTEAESLPASLADAAAAAQAPPEPAPLVPMHPEFDEEELRLMDEEDELCKAMEQSERDAAAEAAAAASHAEEELQRALAASSAAELAARAPPPPAADAEEEQLRCAMTESAQLEREGQADWAVDEPAAVGAGEAAAAWHGAPGNGMDVAAFLVALGLSQLLGVMQENEIDIGALQAFEAADFEEVGITEEDAASIKAALSDEWEDDGGAEGLAVSEKLAELYSSEPPLECDLCGNPFVLSALFQHREQCTVQQRPCGYCGEQWPSSLLEQHESACTSRGQCGFCGAVCPADFLEEHIEECPSRARLVAEEHADARRRPLARAPPPAPWPQQPGVWAETPAVVPVPLEGAQCAVQMGSTDAPPPPPSSCEPNRALRDAGLSLKPTRHGGRQSTEPPPPSLAPRLTSAKHATGSATSGRVISIDGANVAVNYGGRRFSTRGLEIAIQYILDHGHTPRAFVRKARLINHVNPDLMADDTQKLRQLVSAGHVFLVPNDHNDDIDAILYGAQHRGFILSNDQFRAEMNSRSALDPKLIPFIRKVSAAFWLRSSFAIGIERLLLTPCSSAHSAASRSILWATTS